MVLAVLIATTVVLPAMLVMALAADAARRIASGVQPSVARFVLFAWIYLLAQAVGLAWLLLIWLCSGFEPVSRHDKIVRQTARVQRVWAGALFASVRALYRLRFVVDGDDNVIPGPVLVFIRHASIIDTLVPTVFFTSRHGLRLRFVLKRELLVDPCLDVAGHRLRNHFVARDSGDSEAEIAAVRALAGDLAPDEGVLIYPEGTRFTPARRKRVLERLRSGDPSLLARATELRNVLPPRPGGTLALLEGAPDADAVFVAHSGLEGFARLRDILAGGLVGRTVRVHTWRVPRAEIPRERKAQIAWLYDQWRVLDDWIAAVPMTTQEQRGSASTVVPCEQRR